MLPDKASEYKAPGRGRGPAHLQLPDALLLLLHQPQDLPLDGEPLGVQLLALRRGREGGLGRGGTECPGWGALDADGN